MIEKFNHITSVGDVLVALNGLFVLLPEVVRLSISSKEGAEKEGTQSKYYSSS